MELQEELQEDWAMEALDELDLEAEAQRLAGLNAIDPQNMRVACEMLDACQEYPELEALLVNNQLRPNPHIPAWWDFYPDPSRPAHTYFLSLRNVGANARRQLGGQHG